jgi:hypothetical protein
MSARSVGCWKAGTIACAADMAFRRLAAYLAGCLRTTKQMFWGTN